MPVKEGVGYHIKGPVDVVDDHTLTRIKGQLSRIFLHSPETPKIVIPPLPRYLYAGCCPDTQHCSNRGDERYQERLLGKIEHLRSKLKGELNRLGVH